MRFTTFCEKLLRVVFTAAQRVAFAVLFDAVLPDDPLVATMFGALGEVPPVARRVAVIVKGARVGGTRFSATRLVHLALTLALPPLAGGEGAWALIVGPDTRLARQALAFALGACTTCAEIAERVQNVTADSFQLVRDDGVVVTVACMPATAGGSAVRGRTLVGALMTEGAFFRDVNSVVNDEEIYRALLPRIVKGGQLIIESTPWSELGLLYQLFEKNWGHPVNAIVAHCPTLLMRDGDEDTAAIVASETERDPLNASREYGAQFITAGSSAFFDPALIDAAVDDDLAFPAAPDPSCGRVCTADLGFRLDSSALVILQNRGALGVMLAYADEVAPTTGAPLVPSTVMRRFGTAIRQYHGAHLFVDLAYIESVRELCWARGLGVYELPHGQPGKIEQHLACREMLAEKRLRIPRHPRLIAQLKAIIVKPTAGGGMAISTPRRRGHGHGDLASAFVGAAYVARTANAGERARAELAERSRRTDVVLARMTGGEAAVAEYMRLTATESVYEGLARVRREREESGADVRDREAHAERLRRGDPDDDAAAGGVLPDAFAESPMIRSLRWPHGR